MRRIDVVLNKFLEPSERTGSLEWPAVTREVNDDSPRANLPWIRMEWDDYQRHLKEFEQAELEWQTSNALPKEDAPMERVPSSVASWAGKAVLELNGLMGVVEDRVTSMGPVWKYKFLSATRWYLAEMIPLGESIGLSVEAIEGMMIAAREIENL